MLNVQITAKGQQIISDRTGHVTHYNVFGYNHITGMAEPKVVKFCTQVPPVSGMEVPVWFIPVQRSAGMAYRLIPSHFEHCKRAKLGVYQNSKTPKPIVTKFGVGDYVGDMAQQAKIQTDRPSGGVPANGWNITLAWFLIFFFVTTIFARVPRLNRENGFLRGFIHRISIPGNWFSEG